MQDIQQIIKDTASEVVFELKRQGLLKDNTKTPFQKTEQLLYNYNSFKSVIAEKQKTIADIKENGLPKKSKSITSFAGGDGMRDNKMEQELIIEQIESIEKSIVVTLRFIKIIDDALDKLKDDKYFDVIPMKYFEGKTYEEIATIMEKDVSTISRNRNRLINELKIRLFSDEVIYEIFS